MPRVGFEPMISVFQRTKIFRALDRSATVIGSLYFQHRYFRASYADGIFKRTGLIVLLPDEGVGLWKRFGTKG
jgi:hypothetical protein